jgi:hypothetical protein
MLYNIFDLFFNKESHYGQLVREFRFALYTGSRVNFVVVSTNK